MKAIEDGELVDIVFLSSDYPMFYKKEVDEKNKAIKSDAEVLNKEPKLLEYSYKDSGIEWKAAVLRRNEGRGEPNSVTIDIDNQEISMPDQPIITSILVWGPREHYVRRTKDGKKIGDWIREIGGRDLIDNRPKITNLFPSINELKQDDKEQQRKETWRKIMSWWDGLTEEEAKNILNTYVAKKMLVYKKTDDKTVEYMDIKPGTIVRAKVIKKGNSKYFNVIAFSYMYKDPETKKWKRDYYSNGGIYNDFGPSIAERISAAFEELQERYRKNQQTKRNIELARQQAIDNEEDEYDGTPWEE